MSDAKPETSAESPKRKKKQSAAAMRRELQELANVGKDGADKPPVDLKKAFVRVGAIVAVLWVVALFMLKLSIIPVIVAGVLTAVAGGVSIWLVRYVNKSRELGALLRTAGQTEEGRKEALRKLESDFKKGDVQASMARAQLEMQEDPRKALETLQAIDLSKQLGPVADQVRCTRASIHLQLGEVQEAKALVDKMDIGKQQEPKTRAMFASIAAEVWGRTGEAKRAIELLEVFNPDDADFAEMRVQMWRARAFAYAGMGDTKGASRSLKKLADVNPQLLGMFLGTKRVHPLLQQEAKQLLQRSGAVQRKMIRPKM